MKTTIQTTTIALLICGAALLGIASSASAQGTLTITGTGSGTLNGVGFSNNSFLWVLTYSTMSPYTGFGAGSTVYTTLTSQISLNGGSAFNVTGSPGVWIANTIAGHINAAPMVAIPGSNILTMYGTPGWDGVSAFTSSNPSSQFNQFNNIATDLGALTMSSGSVSLLTISGVAPVPEPSTLALSSLGGLGGLLMLRRRK